MYSIFEYRYIDRNTKSRFCIYSRTQEVADEIITIVNDLNVYRFEKPRFRRFKRRYLSEMPPYELEQEQLENVKKARNKRYEYFSNR